MHFKCIVAARMTSEQIYSGLKYHYAFLPDGALGHQGSCNCALFVSEESFPYGLALSKASSIHVSHIPYQDKLLVAQGYVPLWVYVEEE